MRIMIEFNVEMVLKESMPYKFSSKRYRTFVEIPDMSEVVEIKAEEVKEVTK